MAMQPETVYLPNDPTPLTATQLPNGEIVISHQSTIPVYSLGNNPSTALGLLDGQIMGVDKKLIALGVLAYFLFKK